MQVVRDDHDNAAACLSYFGQDIDGFMDMVMSVVCPEPGDGLRGDSPLNIVRYSALALCGRAGILAEVTGPRSAIETARARIRELAKGRGEFGDLIPLTAEEALPQRADISPFYWRLAVLAPDRPGELKALSAFLRERGIKITACRGEILPPKRRALAGDPTCDLRLTIMLPLRLERSELVLALDIRSRNAGWLNWSLEPQQ